MRTALLLSGHGSHLNARSGEAVRDHARRLAARGAWDEVLVAYWKEEPSLARALDGCAADAVTVVPVFMSEGYFTNEVIPAELGLDGRVTQKEGRTVRSTRPAGVHPALADVIVERAQEAGAGPEGALFVLGHGTRRNAGSARNVHAQAARVRATGRFAQVTAVFTDQDPNVASIGALAGGASGHGCAVLRVGGVARGAGLRDADGIRGVRFTAPAGTHPAMADVIADLACEAARW